MKQEIAEKWANALLSKAYKQGRYQLRNSNDEFCCLGVLCDLHAIEHPEIARTHTHQSFYLDRRVALPDAVVEWAGMKSKLGAIKPGLSLSKINDDGVSFEKIAKIILDNFKYI